MAKGGTDVCENRRIDWTTRHFPWAWILLDAQSGGNYSPKAWAYIVSWYPKPGCGEISPDPGAYRELRSV